jgi:hypothetical protein
LAGVGGAGLAGADVTSGSDLGIAGEVGFNSGSGTVPAGAADGAREVGVGSGGSCIGLPAGAALVAGALAGAVAGPAGASGCGLSVALVR